jgi:heme exporter protein C
MSTAELRAELFEGKKGLPLPPLLVLLTVLTAGMIAVGVWMVFFYAPVEKQMGFVQKIFYFHVPAAWVMFLATAVTAVGSVGYLIKRTDTWDRVGDTAVELAVIFGAMVLITGPLWGRKAWGAYWVWDVRLTSSLVLVLTLVACKIVRGYAGASAKQISSGLAVFAVINSIFVYYSVDLWRGTHPPKLINRKGGLAPEMSQTLWFCVLTFVLVFVCLFWVRLRQAKLRAAMDRLHMQAAEIGLDD